MEVKPSEFVFKMWMSDNSGHDYLQLDFHLLDIPITYRWIKKMREVLAMKDSWASPLSHLEKNYFLHGFTDGNRNLEYLCQQMNLFITKMNTCLQRQGLDHHIDLEFKPELVFKNGLRRQGVLNEIHHHFEILSGPVWDRSNIFQSLDLEGHFCLRQINNLCHELESLSRNLEKKSKKINQYLPHHIMTFSLLKSPRFNLDAKDYDFFSLSRNFGQMYLHYCQTGKTWWEAYIDDDDIVDDPGISGLRYYSAEFDVDLGPLIPESMFKSGYYDENQHYFFEWLKEKGQDPADKKLALGRLVFGNLDLSPFLGLSYSQIITKLSRFSHCVKVELCGQGRSDCLEFPYHWEDQNYLERQFELSKKDSHIIY